MPKILSLYLDDSGTRNPDRKPDPNRPMDWFALGGVLINEEDEETARSAHKSFCEKWNITSPLHSSEIRQMEGNFRWLRSLSEGDRKTFMEELSAFLLSIPVVGHACVIDRSGYDARYREKYGRQTWMLCRTAFTVLCERSAKFALDGGRKLRVFPEATDKKADRYVRTYYSELKQSGMNHFSATNSAQYAPLSPEQLNETLYDLKFKDKTSPLAQIADLYLYPLARGGYQPEYMPYAMLNQNHKIIDCMLDESARASLGVKYSCFDFKAVPENTKAEVSLGFRQPPEGDLTG